MYNKTPFFYGTGRIYERLRKGIRKFFSNKNTVTVVGVILAIVVLYMGYSINDKLI